MDAITRSEQETLALGKRLGETLQSGDTVLLKGELGAGKTVLARGLARGLGFENGVTSPTYTLVNEYRAGGRGLIHMDQYRITPEEFWQMGLDEYWDGHNIVLVEWPREVPEMGRLLCIDIAYREDGSRQIHAVWRRTMPEAWGCET